MKSDYEILKKHYGENFARLCRTLFPTILETPGLLSETIMSKFAPSRSLYDDIIENDIKGDFFAYIYSIASQNA